MSDYITRDELRRVLEAMASGRVESCRISGKPDTDYAIEAALAALPRAPLFPGPASGCAQAAPGGALNVGLGVTSSPLRLDRTAATAEPPAGSKPGHNNGGRNERDQQERTKDQHAGGHREGCEAVPDLRSSGHTDGTSQVVFSGTGVRDLGYPAKRQNPGGEAQCEHCADGTGNGLDVRGQGYPPGLTQHAAGGAGDPDPCAGLPQLPDWSDFEADHSGAFCGAREAGQLREARLRKALAEALAKAEHERGQRLAYGADYTEEKELRKQAERERDEATARERARCAAVCRAIQAACGECPETATHCAEAIERGEGE